jgi:transposase
LTLVSPYYTHQVLELPPITMDVVHWVLYQGWCPECSRWKKAQVPTEHATGYGPRFSALMGEVAGTYGNGHRMVQTFCASVLRVPISLGAIQKVLDRVTQAIDPYYAVIARQARQASVNYIDETPWYCLNALAWLWVMASERVAFYMIHPRRSKEAFAALIDDWEGLLVSDGYGVYQSWVQARQPAWRTSSVPPVAWRHGPNQTSWPVVLGRWPSYNGCVIWPQPRPWVGSGAPGTPGCVN